MLSLFRDIRSNGGDIVIVLNLKLNNIYGFEDFEVNFTYPKKVVNSIIEEEYLEGRERFRYNRAVVLMGTNATGKTSLGKALLRIFSYINTGNISELMEMVQDSDQGSFCIDFVNEGYILHRISCVIMPSKTEVAVKYECAEISKMDSYEKCINKLTEKSIENKLLKNLVGKISYRFAYPEIETKLLLNNANQKLLLKTLKAVIGTLDPSLQDISISRDLKDSFIIRRKDTEIIIQEGKLLNRDILSSGTAEGIDVAVFLASMFESSNSFYYCDEHFSYIQSDIEKRIFGIMLDKLGNNEQLIFTTHNTDMFNLNLPKHAYIFLRKKAEGNSYKTTAISASDILKRNTDSIRNAVENDVFSSLPDDSLLDEFEEDWNNG